MTNTHPTNQDRRTNRLVGVLALLGISLVATGLFTGNDTISTIGGVMAAISLILSR